MECFRDLAGRLWDVGLTVAAAKRVLRLTGNDLCRPNTGDPPLRDLLYFDDCRFADVLFAALLPVAEARGLADADFAAGLGGAAIADAREAFYEAWCAFFPAPEEREPGPDEEASKRRAEGEARELLHAAEVHRRQGAEQIARAALRKILEEFPETKAAIKARELLGAEAEQKKPAADVWTIIDEWAAIVGVFPDPFTLRELDRMARGRMREDWRRTSHIMAATIGAHTGKMPDPNQFNPLLRDKHNEARARAAGYGTITDPRLLAGNWCAAVK